MLAVTPYTDLHERINPLLPDSLFPPANAAITVFSLDRNEVLYALNPSLLFTPASNQKLLTTAAALTLLGPEFELRTVAHVDSADSVIYVKGDGDPLFSLEDLDSLVRQISRGIPARRSWALVGDVSAFDGTVWGPGWMWDDEPDSTAMFISPLSINRNVVGIRLLPAAAHGEPPTVALYPPTDHVMIANAAVTVRDSVKERISITPLAVQGRSGFSIAGQVKLRDSTYSTRVSVRDPARYFLSLLRSHLESAGITVSETRLDSMTAGFPIAQCVRRLDSVLIHMNQISDNLSAECVFRTLGRVHGGVGSSEAGQTAVKSYLAGLGIDTSRISVADGSGVSRYNLATAEVLLKVLKNMYHSPHGASFNRSLPLAGRSGNLDRRFRGTPAEGNLRAKTGTLRGVGALAGYVRTGDGELVAFVILIQHYTAPARVYRTVIDSIGVLLSSLRREDL